MTQEEILKTDFYDFCGTASVGMTDIDKLEYYKTCLNQSKMNKLLEALKKSKERMEQDADTWGDTGLLPEDPVYLSICEALADYQ